MITTRKAHRIEVVLFLRWGNLKVLTRKRKGLTEKLAE